MKYTKEQKQAIREQLELKYLTSEFVMTDAQLLAADRRIEKEYGEIISGKKQPKFYEFTEEELRPGPAEDAVNRIEKHLIARGYKKGTENFNEQLSKLFKQWHRKTHPNNYKK